MRSFFVVKLDIEYWTNARPVCKISQFSGSKRGYLVFRSFQRCLDFLSLLVRPGDLFPDPFKFFIDIGTGGGISRPLVSASFPKSCWSSFTLFTFFSRSFTLASYTLPFSLSQSSSQLLDSLFLVAWVPSPSCPSPRWLCADYSHL